MTPGRFSRSEWLTIPNAITVARMLLLVPIAHLLITDQLPILTAVLLAIFGMTDWVDGYIARRFNQVSRVGEILDPIADRVGVAAIAIVLVTSHYLPDWIAYCIVLTDLALAAVYLLFRARHRPPVSPLGKTRTAVLMAGLPLTVFGRIPGLEAIAIVGVLFASLGAILHAITGLTYAWAIYTQSRTGTDQRA
ncbi:CDP-alcohol phosphatidyltransferase family protein [Flaviflexus salsibiostraticola]|uniref:CDP-alcohol phosphatidyltransferase family protein n=1 Tax=Flaviflexus salsibiostraticola TaxID=1282737 RepID=A0A3Q8WTQ4_9ACTO|nr:CDP-alcohol phosphatidyltransferase family protein [Flaviflexus salsibiostraticola]AZN29028.1 CDP-alcohol phosphatidyltransferase family protein [Flaviflexus salsibiostraticola]